MPDLVIAFKGAKGVVAFVFSPEALDDWSFLTDDQKATISIVVKIIASGRRPPDVEHLYPDAPTDARDILRWKDREGLEFWFEEARPELRDKVLQRASSRNPALGGLNVDLPKFVRLNNLTDPPRAYLVYRIKH